MYIYSLACHHWWSSISCLISAHFFDFLPNLAHPLNNSLWHVKSNQISVFTWYNYFCSIFYGYYQDKVKRCLWLCKEKKVFQRQHIIKRFEIYDCNIGLRWAATSFPNCVFLCHTFPIHTVVYIFVLWYTVDLYRTSYLYILYAMQSICFLFLFKCIFWLLCRKYSLSNPYITDTTTHFGHTHFPT